MDRVREADLADEGSLAADEEVVNAAEPVGVARVQHDREPFAREILVRVDEMERTSACVRQLIPVPVHVDQHIVQVDVGVLIRHRKENVVDKVRRILRNLPREIDRLRARRNRGRRRVVVAFPVEMIRVEPDDILVLRTAFHRRIDRTDRGVWPIREVLPREYRNPGDCNDTRKNNAVSPDGSNDVFHVLTLLPFLPCSGEIYF